MKMDRNFPDLSEHKRASRFWYTDNGSEMRFAHCIHLSDLRKAFPDIDTSMIAKKDKFESRLSLADFGQAFWVFTIRTNFDEDYYRKFEHFEFFSKYSQMFTHQKNRKISYEICLVQRVENMVRDQ